MGMRARSRQFFVLADAARGLHPVQPRHVDVGQNQIEIAGRRRRHRIEAGGDFMHRMAAPAQKLARQQAR